MASQKSEKVSDGFVSVGSIADARWFQTVIGLVNATGSLVDIACYDALELATVVSAVYVVYAVSAVKRSVKCSEAAEHVGVSQGFWVCS